MGHSVYVVSIICTHEIEHTFLDNRTSHSSRIKLQRISGRVMNNERRVSPSGGVVRGRHSQARSMNHPS